MDQAPVRIAAISLAVTAGLLALKLAAALASDSIAVFGDAVDSGTDLTAGMAALISVRIAAQPADESHPYGHGKVEAISAAVAATIVALGGGFVVVQAVRRLVGEPPPIDVGLGLAAMAVAAAANAVMVLFMRREAARSGSVALKAEARHLETNVVQAITIISGLLLVAATGEEMFDALFALALAAYMGIVAFGLVRTALADVMDAALPGEDLAMIRAILDAHSADIAGIAGYHRLRSRKSGAERHVDLHLAVAPNMSVEEAHAIADRIERDIQSRLARTTVVIHLEPGE